MKKVRIRSDFGKVADAVLLCELTDVGPIAYRRTELLEYRVHPAQDSAGFPEHVLWKLDGFLVRKGSSSPVLAKAIYENIRRLETGRYLGRWILSVKRNRSLSSAIDGIRVARKPYFSWKAAVGHVANRLAARVHADIPTHGKLGEAMERRMSVRP